VGLTPLYPNPLELLLRMHFFDRHSDERLAEAYYGMVHDVYKDPALRGCVVGRSSWRWPADVKGAGGLRGPPLRLLHMCVCVCVLCVLGG
jgi:hypothetical protein